MQYNCVAGRGRLATPWRLVLLTARWRSINCCVFLQPGPIVGSIVGVLRRPKIGAVSSQKELAYSYIAELFFFEISFLFFGWFVFVA